MSNDSNRFGFFKNKSRAGITEPFTGYPTWPTMPNTSTYTNFVNNSTYSANISYTRENSGAIANASVFNTGNTVVVSDFTGNVSIIDWKDGNLSNTTQMPVYTYSYLTSDVTTSTLNYTDNLGGASAGPANKYASYVWDDDGHIHLLPKTSNGIWNEIGYEYDISAGTLSNFYIGPSGGDWGFSDFLGADGIAQFKDKTVLCANDENFQGGVGRTDQKYQIYDPNTKSMSNSALAYPNDQIASGNISSDCSTLVLVDVTETNSSNVFFLPGLGCFKGSYGTGSANTNTSVIFEANVTTGIVTEHEPANLTTAFNREGLSLKNETIFSTAVYGADLKIYAFPGSSDLNNGTDRAQGIMRMDPTDPANATLDTYSIWDTGTEGNAHLSLPAFLGADGYVHWVMGLTGTANVYLCSLDTNPTSATYLTGYKQNMLYTQRYNVTSYTGSATSTSGFDEVVLDVSEAISGNAFPLTQFSTIPSNNSNLAFLTPGTPYLWRKSGTVNTYFLATSASTSPDTRLQSGLGGEDPDGLAFDLNVVDPTFRTSSGKTRNVGYTANGKVIMAPTYTNEVNPLYNNEPIHVFNVNGTGYWKTQYATWNRNGFNPKSLDT